ncbi:uncharacterized protein BX663DRAFT_526384 [Cokeromyces recurvatus]|uniref:uncharacterized protein n=1 Tax=Cokeromyces recurvatus TaxID=90255 RepID=UPI00221FD85E|nr:uncharacterized protein BX663DRAFT_526384 [Cokeromyces recurvatus]KAI7898026.1 hypothetical protein BX663DRAFT_526384 [Cokeromyces recurvatus]
MQSYSLLVEPHHYVVFSSNLCLFWLNPFIICCTSFMLCTNYIIYTITRYCFYIFSISCI